MYEMRRIFYRNMCCVWAPYYQYPSALRDIIRSSLLRPKRRKERIKSEELEEKEERRESKSRNQIGRRVDNDGWISIDCTVRHGQTASSPRTPDDRFISDRCPQSTIHTLNILDSRSVGMVSSVYLSVCRGARAHALVCVCTYTYKTRENEGALQWRIWLRFAAMKLVICCTGMADVPFIDRGATTLFELFRLTNALKLVIS